MHRTGAGVVASVVVVVVEVVVVVVVVLVVVVGAGGQLLAARLAMVASSLTSWLQNFFDGSGSEQPIRVKDWPFEIHAFSVWVDNTAE